MSILNNDTNSTTEQRIKLIQQVTKLVFVTLMGLSLLFFSMNTASANSTNEFKFPEELTEGNVAAIQNSNGKYMMTMSTVVFDGKAHWYTLVWDTQTGRSQLYYSNTKAGTKKGHPDYNLPSSPL